jgi:hypothetical protein
MITSPFFGVVGCVNVRKLYRHCHLDVYICHLNLLVCMPCSLHVIVPWAFTRGKDVLDVSSVL